MLDGEYLALNRDKGQALADRVVGEPTAEAVATVAAWPMHPVVLDLDASGGRIALTADFRPGRVRLFVSAGRVLRATYG